MNLKICFKRRLSVELLSVSRTFKRLRALIHQQYIETDKNYKVW